jgi:hypothetical protein
MDCGKVRALGPYRWNWKHALVPGEKSNEMAAWCGLYHKEPPPCDLSDLYVINSVFSTDVD